MTTQGASTKELLIEACRRNNVDLLQEIISGCKSDEEISDLLNNTTSVLGNHLYHEAALRGNCMTLYIFSVHIYIYISVYISVYTDIRISPTANSLSTNTLPHEHQTR